MATKFHAGHFKNGDSTERNGNAKESKLWEGVND